jgi:hypothetical protein
MPLEAGATYVFRPRLLRLRLVGQARRRRLPHRHPPEEEHPAGRLRRTAAAGWQLLYDRIGHLPERLKTTRKNPFGDPVREIGVPLEAGKPPPRIASNDQRPAQEIADLYRRRWRHRAVLPLGKADPQDQALHGTIRERRPHPDRLRPDRLSAAQTRQGRRQDHRQPTRLRQARPRQSHVPTPCRQTTRAAAKPHKRPTRTPAQRGRTMNRIAVPGGRQRPLDNGCRFRSTGSGKLTGPGHKMPPPLP